MANEVEPMKRINYGGGKPRADELISPQQCGYSKARNINPDMLTENDPLLKEFEEFILTMSQGTTIITDDSNLGKGGGYFDDMDLTGGDRSEDNDDSPSDDEDFKAEPIKDDYYCNNKRWRSGNGSKFFKQEAFINILFDQAIKFGKSKKGAPQEEYYMCHQQYEPDVFDDLIKKTS